MHYTFVHKSARDGNVTTFTETTLQSQLYISTNQECLFKHNLGCKNSGNNDAHEKLLDLFIPIIWKNNRLCPPFFPIKCYFIQQNVHLYQIIIFLFKIEMCNGNKQNDIKTLHKYAFKKFEKSFYFFI